MPKWAWWVLGILGAVAVFRDPAGAGHTVHEVVTSAWTFLTNTGS